MKRILTIIISALLVAASYLFVPPTLQAQQPISAKEAAQKKQKSTLIYLNDFSQISKKFDADSGDVRLVSLLSPT